MTRHRCSPVVPGTPQMSQYCAGVRNGLLCPCRRLRRRTARSWAAMGLQGLQLKVEVEVMSSPAWPRLMTRAPRPLPWPRVPQAASAPSGAGAPPTAPAACSAALLSRLMQHASRVFALFASMVYSCHGLRVPLSLMCSFRQHSRPREQGGRSGRRRACQRQLLLSVGAWFAVWRPLAYPSTLAGHGHDMYGLQVWQQAFDSMRLGPGAPPCIPTTTGRGSGDTAADSLAYATKGACQPSGPPRWQVGGGMLYNCLHLGPAMQAEPARLGRR